MWQPSKSLHKNVRMLHQLLPAFGLTIALATLAGSCAKTIKHDENLAAKRAIEFAQVVLVDKNFDKGYELLADGGKRHISPDKFKETVTRLHPRGFPTKVTAKEYQPMPGENAIWIYLVGQNSEDQFQYRLTMEATDTGDYKVLTLDSGVVGRFFSSASEKRSFTNPISTRP
ncbi:MAG TPA: hypothetical protein VEI95_02760 [Acidobacteriota bacterium]|nr:hypothetical protein [Acidobacteriota bacterium]